MQNHHNTGLHVNLQRTVVVVSALLALAACGGDGGSTEPLPPPPNQPPVTTGAIPAQDVIAGETVTVNVASYFNDPDGDALTYTASTSNAGIASSTISGTVLTITGVSAGTATVTVTARDPGGLSATQSASVTVERANQAPVAMGGIATQTLTAGQSVTIDVSSYFSDPDGDALSYAATSSNAAVATASASGSSVTIGAVAAGATTVTVTASDPGGRRRRAFP